MNKKTSNDDDDDEECQILVTVPTNHEEHVPEQ